MKFVSKMSNYRVVLQHSIPAEPITGRNATPGIWVKFENGAAEVRDEATIQMLLNHRLYNTDFVVAEDEKDPYADVRSSIEPDHAITKIEYGHVASSINPQSVPMVSKEMKRLVTNMAKEMAIEMAPGLAKEMLKEVLSQNPELVKGALSEASGVVPETIEEELDITDGDLDPIDDAPIDDDIVKEVPKANKGANKKVK